MFDENFIALKDKYGFSIRRIAITLFLACFVLSWFIKVIEHLGLFNIFYFNKFSGNVTDAIAIFFYFFSLFILTICLNFLFSRLLNYLKIGNSKKELNGIPVFEDWLFSGSLIRTEELKITRSYLGALIRNSYFKNFELSFKVEFISGNKLGVIFRAQDLDNYLMLQISVDEQNNYRIINGSKEKLFDTSFLEYREIGKTYLKLVPHIREGGNFETFEVDAREPYCDTKLEYIKMPLFVKVRVDGLEAKMKIGYHRILESNDWDIIWNIPTNFKPNIIEIINKKKEKDASDFEHEVSREGVAGSIWFRHKYGKIGFRASGLEEAVISELIVKDLGGD